MKEIVKVDRLWFLILFGLALIPFSPFKEIFAGFFMLAFLLWLYSITIFGQMTLEEKGFPTMGIKIFKLTTFALPLLLLTQVLLSFKHCTESYFVVIFNIILICLTIISVFYVYYFTAKTITTLEKGKDVSFFEMFVNLMLISLSIIGVWFIQPKMKDLI